MNNTDRPLWLLMRDAYEESSGSIIGNGGSVELPGPDREFAAMLRVVANRISPPEEESHDFTHGSIAEIQWRECRKFRNILLAEADNAEQSGQYFMKFRVEKES